MHYALGSKIIAHLSKIDLLVKNKVVFPVTCEIDTSNFCQNDCEWCIYHDYLNDCRMHLDYHLFKWILRQLKMGGCKTLTFTGGGEPLLNPKITEMLEFAHSMGFRMGLITNGILLDKIARQICYFDFIRVSVDAASENTYKKVKNTNYFDRVCTNIKEITSMDLVDIGISMVYTADTKKEAIQDFPKLGKELKVTYTQIKPVLDSSVILDSQTIKNTKEILATPRYLVESYLPCKIAGLIGQVAANGKYYYCCIHRGVPKYEIGDFSKESLPSILQKRVKFNPDLSDCNSCRYMNYAKEYKEVIGDKFRILRHINFL